MHGLWTIIILYALLWAFDAQSQDTIKSDAPKLTISGMVDVFYGYDIPPPENSKRQVFLYSYNRYNEFELNLGLVKLSVTQSKYRSNLAVQTGTYPFDNYAAESEPFKMIHEANAGISLNKKKTLWLDAGIFASPIGFESAVAFDNWTLTRSLLADNSPYYLSGIKFTHTPNKKWMMLVVVCNGWQRIKKVDGNGMLSAGTQIKYSPGTASIFNWTTFLGTDDPDSTRRIRYFNNFYGQFQLSKRVGLIVGFDVGIQQKAKNANQFDHWFSPVIMARYSVSEQWKMACRVEYYQDKAGVIIRTGSIDGFRAMGLSCNLDYSPVDNMLCRLESRWLHCANLNCNEIGSGFGNKIFFTASIAVRFNSGSIPL